VALFWFSQYVFVPYFTPHLTGLGIASSAVGLITGMYGFSQLMLRIPLGIAADKLRNHRIFIGLGFIGLVLAGAVPLFSNSPAAFLASRFLAGASASTWVSFTVFFSSIYGGSGGKAIGVIMAANNLGTMLSYVLGMVLFDRVGFNNLYRVSMVAAALGFLLLLTIRENAPTPSRNMTISAALHLLRDKNLMLHSMIAALLQLIIFATASSFTNNYAKELGASGMQIGFASVMLNGVAFIGSWWVSTNLRERISERVWFIVGFACLAASCFLVPYSTTMVGVYVAQGLSGAGRSLLMALTMAASSRNVPAELKSTAMGVYQSLYGIGMTLGPIVMGAFLDLSGSYLMAFGAIGIASVAGVVWSAMVVGQAKKS
jgi:MFS family permease